MHDTTHSDTFGRIRSLLQSPPSTESWAALWELLSALEGHELERTIVYASALLERWPDALRTYGRALLWRRADSTAVRLQPLCRTLDLSNLRHTLRYFVRDEVTRTKDSAFAFGHITRLDLSASQEPFPDIVKFMRASNMSALREIDLSRSRRMSAEADDEIAAFADALAELSGPVSLDLTKVGWANRRRLTLLLQRAGARIASLNLSQSKQDGATLPALSFASGGALRALDLSRNRVWHHHGVDALSQSGVLAQLEHLNLNRNDLRAEHLATMITALAPRVRTLGLTEVHDSTIVRNALSNGLALPHLRALAADTEGLPPELDAPSLTELELYPNGETAYDLPSHPAFARLTRLTLRRGQDGATVEAICARADLGALRAITLQDVSISDATLEGLARNPTASRIERVEIVAQDIGHVAPGALASLLELPSLQVLELARVTHGTYRLCELLGSPALSRLQTLSLLDCALDDAAASGLFHNDALSRLELLRFRQTGKLSEPTLELLVDPPNTPRHWRPSKHVLSLRADRARQRREEDEKDKES